MVVELSDLSVRSYKNQYIYREEGKETCCMYTDIWKKKECMCSHCIGNLSTLCIGVTCWKMHICSNNKAMQLSREENGKNKSTLILKM